jgi:hypothetical protein
LTKREAGPPPAAGQSDRRLDHILFFDDNFAFGKEPVDVTSSRKRGAHRHPGPEESSKKKKKKKNKKGNKRSAVPAPGYVLQEGAPLDMRVVSQPPGVSLFDMAGYTYPESAEEGITIYLMDTGFNLDLPVLVITFCPPLSCLYMSHKINHLSTPNSRRKRIRPFRNRPRRRPALRHHPPARAQPGGEDGAAGHGVHVRIRARSGQRCARRLQQHPVRLRPGHGAREAGRHRKQLHHGLSRQPTRTRGDAYLDGVVHGDDVHGVRERVESHCVADPGNAYAAAFALEEYHWDDE